MQSDPHKSNDTPQEEPIPAIVPLPVVKPTTSETYWMRHRLSLLLICTTLIAIILTVVSMVIYTQSGAAQLDLSRPGYKSVSDQVQVEDTSNTFSASGPVDRQTFEDFLKLYDEQSDKAKSVDAFNGDPLNPEVVF